MSVRQPQQTEAIPANNDLMRGIRERKHSIPGLTFLQNESPVDKAKLTLSQVVWCDHLNTLPS